jgi:hypothetical protein
MEREEDEEVAGGVRFKEEVRSRAEPCEATITAMLI